MTAQARLGGWTALVSVLAALAYGSRAAEGKPSRDVLYQWGTAIGGLVQYALMLALVLAIARGPDLRKTLALRRPPSWKRALLLGVGVLAVVYVASEIAVQFSDPGREQGLTPDRWRPDRAEEFAANFVVVAVIAPVVEELLFRGLGFHVLRRFGEWTAIVLVGVAFGLVHGLLEGLPILIVFGAALAYLRSRTRSVYPGMLVHGVFNAVALIAAVTT